MEAAGAAPARMARLWAAFGRRYADELREMGAKLKSEVERRVAGALDGLAGSLEGDAAVKPWGGEAEAWDAAAAKAEFTAELATGHGARLEEEGSRVVDMAAAAEIARVMLLFAEVCRDQVDSEVTPTRDVSGLSYATRPNSP